MMSPQARNPPFTLHRRSAENTSRRHGMPDAIAPARAPEQLDRNSSPQHDKRHEGNAARAQPSEEPNTLAYGQPHCHCIASPQMLGRGLHVAITAN
jgi:hypothetical protein